MIGRNSKQVVNQQNWNWNTPYNSFKNLRKIWKINLFSPLCNKRSNKNGISKIYIFYKSFEQRKEKKKNFNVIKKKVSNKNNNK